MLIKQCKICLKVKTAILSNNQQCFNYLHACAFENSKYCKHEQFGIFCVENFVERFRYNRHWIKWNCLSQTSKTNDKPSRMGFRARLTGNIISRKITCVFFKSISTNMRFWKEMRELQQQKKHVVILWNGDVNRAYPIKIGFHIR